MKELTFWLNTVHCGDALELMKEIPKESIDLIIIDPPYSRFHSSVGEASLGDFKILEVFFRDVAKACHRVIKETGSVFFFCDYRTYPCLFYGVYRWIKPANLIIWQKDFLGPGIRFRPLHELILYCISQKTASPKDRHITDIWKAKRVNNRQHPFQKPLKLFRIMIENCSNQNDVVLDPFCGSGTALIVAQQLGRRWIGIDIEPKYIKITMERLKKYTFAQPLTIFGIDSQASYKDVGNALPSSTEKTRLVVGEQKK